MAFLFDETNAALIFSAWGGDVEKVMHCYVSIKTVIYFTVYTKQPVCENKHGTTSKHLPKRTSKNDLL